MANNIIYTLLDRALLWPLSAADYIVPAPAQFAVPVPLNDLVAAQLLAVYGGLYKGANGIRVDGIRDQWLAALSSQGQAAPPVFFSQGDRQLLQHAVATMQLQISYPLAQVSAPFDVQWQGRAFPKGSNIPLDVVQALGLAS